MTSYTKDIQCDEYFQIHDSYIIGGLTKKVKNKLTIIGDTIDASCGTDFVSNIVLLTILYIAHLIDSIVKVQ